jgi:phage tail tape-measure protein
MNQEIKTLSEDLLDNLDPEHRRRAISAGMGATAGTAVGSMLGGVWGAAVGAALGGVLGVAVGEVIRSDDD